MKPVIDNLDIFAIARKMHDWVQPRQAKYCRRNLETGIPVTWDDLTRRQQNAWILAAEYHLTHMTLGRN